LAGGFPDEIEPDKEYVEGARTQITVKGFERDLQARKACVKKYGFSCAVCAFDFEERYGQVGKAFIHVHHLKPLALTDGEYRLDPVADLRPVCPNCHAMLHRGKTLLSIEELRAML
jgi:5-methylcytosine-specific restriction enzyme A